MPDRLTLGLPPRRDNCTSLTGSVATVPCMSSPTDQPGPRFLTLPQVAEMCSPARPSGAELGVRDVDVSMTAVGGER